MAKTKSRKATKHQTKAKSKARAKPKADSSNGAVLDLAGPKPAPKDGPNLTLRMRSKDLIGRVKQAAVKAGMSVNTYANEVLERAAEAQV